MRSERRIRAGFTLVELLVAAALCMVIMLIIGTAMQKSVDTFRTLRSVSQMQEKLKSVHLVFKRDLEADHFEGIQPGALAASGGPKLSDQKMHLLGWMPPPAGYFCIMEGTPGQLEGTDSDGLPSTRAVTHSLHFTAKLVPDRITTTVAREEHYFNAAAPLNLSNMTPIDFRRAGMFSSQWAEVSYFLVANGDDANGEPLYTLYRRQRLILPSGTYPWQTATENQTLYPDISWGTGATGPQVNTTTSIPPRANRSPLYRVTQPNGMGDVWRPSTVSELAPGSTIAGDDILLADVLSFEVKVAWTADTSATGASQAWEVPRLPIANVDWPYDYLPPLGAATNPRNTQYNNVIYPALSFDTWSIADGTGITWSDPTSIATPGVNQPPLRVRVDSLQIRIRVWDKAGQQARQITIVQDM